MISAAQIRMALAALRWRQEMLADKAGVHWSTVHRAVNADGPLTMRADNLAAIEAALEAGDGSGRCEFIADGVIFRPAKARRSHSKT